MLLLESGTGRVLRPSKSDMASMGGCPQVCTCPWLGAERLDLPRPYSSSSEAEPACLLCHPVHTHFRNLSNLPFEICQF